MAKHCTIIAGVCEVHPNECYICAIRWQGMYVHTMKRMRQELEREKRKHRQHMVDWHTSRGRHAHDHQLLTVDTEALPGVKPMRPPVKRQEAPKARAAAAKPVKKPVVHAAKKPAGHVKPKAAPKKATKRPPVKTKARKGRKK